MERNCLQRLSTSLQAKALIVILFLKYIAVVIFAFLVYFLHIILAIIFHEIIGHIGKSIPYFNNFFVFFEGEIVLFISFLLGGFAFGLIRTFNMVLQLSYCLMSMLVTLLLAEVQSFDDSFILRFKEFAFYFSPLLGSVLGVFLARKVRRNE